VNVYVLVEGRRTEKALYRAWLTSVMPQLRVVDRPEDLAGNSLFILSGNGYPSYKNHIIRSLEDVTRHGNIAALLICVDSEEMSRSEKLGELTGILAKGPPFSGTKLVVHDCCIETWLLGNRKIVCRAPNDELLRMHLKHFDVITGDPESMPPMNGFRVRAHQHLEYLRAVFRERSLVYTKANPGAACDLSYFEELARRCSSTGHMTSFAAFLDVLHEIGAEPHRIRGIKSLVC
jgi:hypothetical protein